MMDLHNPFQDPASLLLRRSPLQKQRIRFLEYAGGGNAGYVFKVVIDAKQYALKMFKFDNPRLNPSRLKGMQRREVYDHFFIECRANGSLIAQDQNGRFTPVCHGWITIPTSIEIYVARKFGIQPFLWDRPSDIPPDTKIRAILFDWVDGKMLYQVQINSKVADQIRAALRGLHQASMTHGDIRAANILVTDDRVYLIDLNSSLTVSHRPRPSLKELQEIELKDLEIGFVLLSRLSINRDVCVADASIFENSSLDEILEIYDLMKHHWSPPMPKSR